MLDDLLNCVPSQTCVRKCNEVIREGKMHSIGAESQSHSGTATAAALSCFGQFGENADICGESCITEHFGPCVLQQHQAHN